MITTPHIAMLADKETRVVSIVPALPGYKLLEPVDGGAEFTAVDIVAWAVDSYCRPWPIAINESFVGDINDVLQPDGRVVALEGTVFDSTNDWLQHCRAEEARAAQATIEREPMKVLA